MVRDERNRRSLVPDAASRSLWRSAAWTGVGAAVVCATLGIVAVAICWLPVSGASAHPMSALHAGLLTFLAALHGGVTVDGTAAGFLPLGLLIVVALTAWRAGSALANAAESLDEADPERLAKALAVQAGAFTVAAMIAVPFAHLGTSSAPVLGVAAGGLVVFGLSAGAALVRSSALAEWSLIRVPGVVVQGARAAVAVLVIYLGAGAMLVAGSLVVHHARVEELSRQVGGGWGGLPILLLGLLAAPNAAIDAVSYLTGPGFAVGTGTHIAPAGTTHGLVPSFPILGALPDGHGATVLVWLLVAATPLLAGGCVARLCYRAATWRARFVELGAAVLVCAIGMAVLAWQAGGSIGSGRLAVIGASPWQAAFTLAGEVGAIGVVALGGAALLSRFRATTAHGRRGASVDRLAHAVTEIIEPLAHDDERATAPQPRLVVVAEAETDDGDEAGKLAG